MGNAILSFSFARVSEVRHMLIFINCGGGKISTWGGGGEDLFAVTGISLRFKFFL